MEDRGYGPGCAEEGTAAVDRSTLGAAEVDCNHLRRSILARTCSRIANR